MDLSSTNKHFIENPYFFYNFLLREEQPFFQQGDECTDMEQQGAPKIRHRPQPDRWFFSRYDDVVNLLKDARLGREQSYDEKTIPPEYRILEAIQKGSMLHRDPPDHTRLRGLVSQAFTPMMIRRLRSQIEQICDDLLDGLVAKQELDWIADFAMPLPVMVISDMLGVPKKDWDRVKNWSHVLAGLLEPGVEPEQIQLGTQSGMEFIQYLQDIFAERRKRPQADLISALLQVEQDGQKLSQGELFATCILLLAAGHETTTNLIGNGLLLLGKHPENMEEIRENPKWIPGAVEEVLRFESPIQRTARFVTEDMVWRNIELKRGQVAVLLLAAANRDVSHFDQPDIFDIHRNPNRHVSFGGGIHHCLGASLARLEATVAFEKVIVRFPSIEIDVTQPLWSEMVIFRGLRQLKGKLS